MIQHDDLSMLHNLPSPVRARVLFLFLMLCFAWDWAGATTAHAAEQGKVKSAGTVMVAPVEEVQELKERVKELEARERQLYAMELENGRKAVDWWLSYIGVLAAIMAIAGGLIPYMMGRKDRALIEKDKEETKNIRDEAEALVSKIRTHAENAEQYSETMRTYVAEKEVKASQEIQSAVRKVSNDNSLASEIRLRAKAIEASEASDAQKAYSLWVALSEIDAEDANVHFNAGYWAHQLANQTQGDVRLHWYKFASEKYQQALSIKPDLYEAAYNWGTALDNMAQMLSKTELETARKLWLQAGEKFQLALHVKPDDHAAANNWGVALDSEAQVLAQFDLDTARGLWKRSGEQYQRALSNMPNKNEAAYNWGVALDNEAQALAQIELDTARGLWRRAGEKYQMALDINPQMYDAVNNWSNALFLESDAVAASEPEEAVRLLKQAESLLLKYAKVAPGENAYNLACLFGMRGDVANCLHWLKVAREHNTLVSCEHMRTDKDLDPVRNNPEFISWLEQACPPQATQEPKA